MILEKNGISYNIKKIKFESDDIFYERMWFIVNLEPTNKIELDEAIHNSILWSNIKFLKCDYGNKINNKIKSIEKSINFF